MAVPPLPRLVSGYGYRSSDQREHYGVDLAPAASDVPVVAPEAGVVARLWTDNATPPWVGYGPGGVVLAGESGRFHLLGHLAPGRLEVKLGELVAEGQAIGPVSAVGHVHWEVRSVAVDEGPATRGRYTVNPWDWLAAQGVTPWGKKPPAPTSRPGNDILIAIVLALVLMS